MAQECTNLSKIMHLPLQVHFLSENTGMNVVKYSHDNEAKTILGGCRVFVEMEQATTNTNMNRCPIAGAELLCSVFQVSKIPNLSYFYIQQQWLTRMRITRCQIRIL